MIGDAIFESPLMLALYRVAEAAKAWRDDQSVDNEVRLRLAVDALDAEMAKAKAEGER